MKVESKSISYHAFSLSFSMSLFSSAEQGEREQSASTWYQSSDLEPTAWNPFLIAYLALLSSTHLQHLMLSLRLPHLPGEQIREVKMIPRSMWRRCANSSSTRDKEKESKWWALGKIEERNRPPPLPACCAEETSREECKLHNQGTLIFLTQNCKLVRDQSYGKSTRSSISKTRFAFLNSTLSGFYCAILVMFIRCLFVCLFLCEFMLETLRTMFDLSVGEGGREG
ncbi:hypothetical protein C1H46_032886 [Malus baccata]|uniref:Uncharacterized protein n=1 Tax=Malus baccata TaxID=106549 RepID=A0A540L4Z9_MALBA|nr:hypothetical protein C1H46_032886 [Malus baccata]